MPDKPSRKRELIEERFSRWRFQGIGRPRQVGVDAGRGPIEIMMEVRRRAKRQREEQEKRRAQEGGKH